MEAVIKNSAVLTWMELLEELKTELEGVEKSSDTRIGKAQRATQLCKNVLTRLEEVMVDYAFTDAQQEIYFFKEIKPKVLSRLIYYHKLFTIEVSLPVGNKKDRQAYLQKELDRIKEFFDDNKFFYQYFRSGETYLDEKLFLRLAVPVALPMQIFDLNTNPAFTTNFDYILSRILANELLLDYLNEALSHLQNESNGDAADKARPAKALGWTESKSALIELIYAFKARGSFNSGKATLKEITDYLQLVFGVEISNPSRDFQDILSRKKSHTVYLDALKESYLKYIDIIDSKSNR
ncbi:MAG: RteC domain-containing protein [Chitinophagaceae bacterium]